ncbi:hypothetical protein BKA69DRAFT_1075513 [Paraphysoderma sedebokerense]|nr:hypothetical protein BKA69DRAFT_1075513 [Paraphysoderma sedebokerense]
MNPIYEKWMVSTNSTLGYQPDAIITDISTLYQKLVEWGGRRDENSNHDENITSGQTEVITPQHQCSHSPGTRRNIVRLNQSIVELSKAVDKSVKTNAQRIVEETAIAEPDSPSHSKDFIRRDGTKIRHEDIMSLGWHAIGGLKGCIKAVLYGFTHNESTFPPMKEWKADRTFARWFRQHNLNFWKHTTWYITVGKVYEQSYSEVTDETLQDFIVTKLNGKSSSSYCKEWAQKQSKEE